MKQIKTAKEDWRFPRAELAIVEQFIREHDGEFTRSELWDKLAGKIHPEHLIMILESLLVHRRISVDAEGKIGWIFYPERAADLGKQLHLFWRHDGAGL